MKHKENKKEKKKKEEGSITVYLGKHQTSRFIISEIDYWSSPERNTVERPVCIGPWS